MKTCGACGQEKDITEFGINNSKKDGRQTQCRECRKTTNAEYYQDTKHLHNPARYERRAQAYKIARAKMDSYLADKTCTDCGTDDVVVLQFDHLRDKKYDVSSMVAQGYLWQSILDEISKCEIVCANCHIHRTRARRSSTKP